MSENTVVGQEFEDLWAELLPIGRSPDSGGYLRRPLEAAERECVAWFAEQCCDRGLRVETDGNGNTVGWWDAPTGSDDDTDAVLTGSHLDSVDDGGAFDGPLGVVSALAAVDRLRAAGFVPARSIGVIAFMGEEGSRFPVACLGSRLAAGLLDADHAAALRDADGVTLVDAMAQAGVSDDLGPTAFLQRVGCFVELHIEQGCALIEQGGPVGVAGGIWPHGRYRFDFAGEANHAGATRMEDRHDPMLTAAMTILAANKQARLQDARATFGRLEVRPNGTNAIPSAVSGWMDARAVTSARLEQLLSAITRLASERAGRDGTTVDVTAESVSEAVAFDEELGRRLVGLGTNRPLRMLPSMAGHDAGILASAGIPSAMIFVRNPTGVSHAPAESAEMADCLAGVATLTRALEELAG